MIQVLISSSVLILVLAALRKLLRGKISLWLQYGLWLLVAVRLLVPVQFGAASFSLSNITERPEQAVQTLMQQPVGNAQTQQETPAEQPAQVQKQDTPAPSQNVPAQNTQDRTQVSDAAAPQTEQAAVRETENAAAGGVTVGQVLQIVWLTGMGVTALWFVAVNASFHRKALRGAKKAVVECCPLPVYVSEHIPSPCLLGLFRPRILLTPEAAQDAQTMRHVITHELTHYRHADHIWALVRAVCLCIYWFDPLVWLAANLSLRDCELACDEGAIKRLGEEERLRYCKTLLDMIAHAGKSRNLLQTATTMASSKKQVKERMGMIVKKPKKLLRAVICLLLVLIVTVGCTFTGGKTKASDKTEETTPTQPTEAEETTPTQAPEVTELTAPTETSSFTQPSELVMPEDVPRSPDGRPYYTYRSFSKNNLYDPEEPYFFGYVTITNLQSGEVTRTGKGTLFTPGIFETDMLDWANAVTEPGDLFADSKLCLRLATRDGSWYLEFHDGKNAHYVYTSAEDLYVPLVNGDVDYLDGPRWALSVPENHTSEDIAQAITEEMYQAYDSWIRFGDVEPIKAASPEEAVRLRSEQLPAQWDSLKDRSLSGRHEFTNSQVSDVQIDERYTTDDYVGFTYTLHTTPLNEASSHLFVGWEKMQEDGSLTVVLTDELILTSEGWMPRTAVDEWRAFQ